MRKVIGSRSFITATAAALLIPFIASAFEPLSPRRRWFDDDRLVRVDSNGKAGVEGDGGVNDAVGAVLVWNNPPGAASLPVLSTFAKAFVWPRRSRGFMTTVRRAHATAKTLSRLPTPT